MIAASFSLRRRVSAAVRDESGAILIFVVISLVVMMGATGLAVDLGRGYVERVRISRAIDAAALSAARSLRLGQPAATAEAIAVAAANGVLDGVNGVSTSLAFGTNARGENTVTFTAQKVVPTIFMRFLGQTHVDVAAAATAAVPPVDLVLVLDQSGSLGSQNAWDDLQLAATTFVQQFDDLIDQVGLVSFQIRANTWFGISNNFTTPITNQIAALSSVGYTNTGEGLRLGGLELSGSGARPGAAKVMVFFTDGRPTAFRGTFGSPGNEQDRIGSVGQTIVGVLRGYDDNPDGLPMGSVVSVDGCAAASSCFGMNENDFRQAGIANGLIEADNVRAQGAFIYTIALGNPNASNPLWQPDLNYLRMIANEGGMADPTQPQGQMFFAPSAAELQLVFNQVANALLVRLAS